MELSSWCSGSEDASLLLSLAWASTSIYVNSLNIRALIKNVYNSVRNNSKKFNDYTALKLRASDELREAEPGFTMNIKQCLLHALHKLQLCLSLTCHSGGSSAHFSDITAALQVGNPQNIRISPSICQKKKSKTGKKGKAW